MSADRAGSGKSRGFTLVELIVTLAILVIVLTVSYRILENCLRTEQWIERETLPEKVGSAIISLIRRDIEGVLADYKKIGSDQIFQIIDGGEGETARDEIQFYTTVEPTPVEDVESRQTGYSEEKQRSITPVSYYIKENAQGLFTLFRREANGIEGDPFTGGVGINYEIYDKVKSLSFYAFDATPTETSIGYVAGAGTGEMGFTTGGESPWVPAWDSRQRIALAEEEDQELVETASTGIARIPSTTSSSSQTTTKGQGVEAESTDTLSEQPLLPPAAIPTAVRVEIAIYVGDEKGLFKDKTGNFLPPKVYSAVIPIFAALRIPLPQEEEGLEGAETTGGTDPTGGESTTGTRSGISTQPAGGTGGTNSTSTGLRRSSSR